MSRNLVTKPWFGKLECGISILTTLVLASVLTAVTVDLRPQTNAATDGSRAATGSVPVEKHGDRGTGPSANAGAKPGVARAMKQAAAPLLESNGAAAGEAEAQEFPAAAPAAATQRSPAVFGQGPESSLLDFIGKTILILAVVFALAIIAALVIVHCVFGLLRRHCQHGPLIRIEYVGAPIAVAPVPATAPVGAMQNSVPAAPDRTASSFDFGPAFETERQVKEDQTARREQAVLQHLFADNLKLQEQIKSGKAIEQAPASDKKN